MDYILTITDYHKSLSYNTGISRGIYRSCTEKWADSGGS